MAYPLGVNEPSHLANMAAARSARAPDNFASLRGAIAPTGATSTPNNAIAMPILSSGNLQISQAVEPLAHAALPPMTPQRGPERRMFHPNGAPSSVVSENVLAARNDLAPAPMHNEAAIRRAYISDMTKLAPRFEASVSVLA